VISTELIESEQDEETQFMMEQRREQRAISRNKNSAGSSGGNTGSGGTSSRRVDCPNLLSGKLSPPRGLSPQNTDRKNLEDIREESDRKSDKVSSSAGANREVSD